MNSEKMPSFLKNKLVVGLSAALVLSLAGCGYLYSQLADYRANKAEFVEYQKSKEENDIKLQKLLQDNEKMLRDMSELSNLEKKLRRAIIRDTDSTKLSSNAADLGKSNAEAGYTGAGGPKEDMDANTYMAVLEAQNKNIGKMIQERKTSVSELLSELEGRGGTMSSFPDRWPTDGGRISSPYGARTGPIEGGYEWHCGLDIAVDYGTPVYASAAGTVEKAAMNGGYGLYVQINHGNGYETAYGHMSSLVVTAGQKVAKGEIIGLAGSTGYSTGPHVHFEVLNEGQPIDPYYVVKHN